MFIAVAMICTGGVDVEPECKMYLWPESFVSAELCDSFATSQLYSQTPIGLIAHVACFDLKELDSEA
jgi:hypothetical protein